MNDNKLNIVFKDNAYVLEGSVPASLWVGSKASKEDIREGRTYKGEDGYMYVPVIPEFESIKEAVEYVLSKGIKEYRIPEAI